MGRARSVKFYIWPNVIYQIKRIEDLIALVQILLKLGHYVIQDGRKKVKSSFYKLLLQAASSPNTLRQ